MTLDSSCELRPRGAYTALVTPFVADGSAVDFDAFDALVQRQLDGGVAGLVPCGTTGEASTISDEEKIELVRRTVGLVKGRAVVLAGTGSNCTSHSIRVSQGALEAGADAIMLVMPYYNKPCQQGLFAHIEAIARAVHPAPIVLYNIPGRAGVDLGNDTLARVLDAAPNVVSIKDATGNVLRCQQMVARFGERLSVMCGDDALTVAMMALGAKGVISVTSNVLPKQVARVCEAALQGDWQLAKRLHFAMLSVHEAMFVEPNPGPVKAALASKQLLSLTVRMPLSVPSQSAVQHVVQAVRNFEQQEGKDIQP